MDNDNWQCCSLKNKNEIKYFIQCGFGLMVISFSMYQIIRNDTDKNVWIGMLSTTFGLFLPAPTIRD